MDTLEERTAEADESLNDNYDEGLAIMPTEVLAAHEIWLQVLPVNTQIKALLMQGLTLENIEQYLGPEVWSQPEVKFQVGLWAYRTKDYPTAVRYLESLALAGHKKATTYLLLAAICGEQTPESYDLGRRCITDLATLEPELSKRLVPALLR